MGYGAHHACSRRPLRSLRPPPPGLLLLGQGGGAHDVQRGADPRDDRDPRTRQGRSTLPETTIDVRVQGSESSINDEWQYFVEVRLTGKVTTGSPCDALNPGAVLRVGQVPERQRRPAHSLSARRLRRAPRGGGIDAAGEAQSHARVLERLSDEDRPLRHAMRRPDPCPRRLARAALGCRRRSLVHAAASPVIVLFDGSCRFCTRSAHSAPAHLRPARARRTSRKTVRSTRTPASPTAAAMKKDACRLAGWAHLRRGGGVRARDRGGERARRRGGSRTRITSRVSSRSPTGATTSSAAQSLSPDGEGGGVRRRDVPFAPCDARQSWTQRDVEARTRSKWSAASRRRTRRNTLLGRACALGKQRRRPERCVHWRAIKSVLVDGLLLGHPAAHLRCAGARPRA